MDKPTLENILKAFWDFSDNTCLATRKEYTDDEQNALLSEFISIVRTEQK